MLIVLQSIELLVSEFTAFNALARVKTLLGLTEDSKKHEDVFLMKEINNKNIEIM